MKANGAPGRLVVAHDTRLVDAGRRPRRLGLRVARRRPVRGLRGCGADQLRLGGGSRGHRERHRERQRKLDVVDEVHVAVAVASGRSGQSVAGARAGSPFGRVVWAVHLNAGHSGQSGNNGGGATGGGRWSHRPHHWSAAHQLQKVRRLSVRDAARAGARAARPDERHAVSPFSGDW